MALAHFSPQRPEETPHLVAELTLVETAPVPVGERPKPVEPVVGTVTAQPTPCTPSRLGQATLGVSALPAGHKGTFPG